MLSGHMKPGVPKSSGGERDERWVFVNWVEGGKVGKRGLCRLKKISHI